MARLGMDVDAIERLAGGLHQNSVMLNQLNFAVAAMAAQAKTEWQGADSEAFLELWRVEYQPVLERAARSLEEFSLRATENARAQRQVSSF